MIDEIIDLITKEARTRRPQALDLSILMVSLEVMTKVFAAFEPLPLSDNKSNRFTLRYRSAATNHED